MKKKYHLLPLVFAVSSALHAQTDIDSADIFSDLAQDNNINMCEQEYAQSKGGYLIQLFSGTNKKRLPSNEQLNELPLDIRSQLNLCKKVQSGVQYKVLVAGPVEGYSNAKALQADLPASWKARQPWILPVSWFTEAPKVTSSPEPKVATTPTINPSPQAVLPSEVVVTSDIEEAETASAPPAVTALTLEEKEGELEASFSELEFGALASEKESDIGQEIAHAVENTRDLEEAVDPVAITLSKEQEARIAGFVAPVFSEAIVAVYAQQQADNQMLDVIDEKSASEQALASEAAPETPVESISIVETESATDDTVEGNVRIDDGDEIASDLEIADESVPNLDDPETVVEEEVADVEILAEEPVETAVVEHDVVEDAVEDAAESDATSVARSDVQEKATAEVDEPESKPISQVIDSGKKKRVIILSPDA
ncbi:hypothetical protein [Thaumasiovibrio subtropicus]|uniref:hypothetical protein n=1 Tax=Thaumasiovibrio subtropicus TaxID=1891207 RepID=UPI000B35C31E|nr:hypothetical protein [Thaumasiovibrio subtropicus]